MNTTKRTLLITVFPPWDIYPLGWSFFWHSQRAINCCCFVTACCHTTMHYNQRAVVLTMVLSAEGGCIQVRLVWVGWSNCANYMTISTAARQREHQHPTPGFRLYRRHKKSTGTRQPCDMISSQIKRSYSIYHDYQACRALLTSPEAAVAQYDHHISPGEPAAKGGKEPRVCRKIRDGLCGSVWLPPVSIAWHCFCWAGCLLWALDQKW